MSLSNCPKLLFAMVEPKSISDSNLKILPIFYGRKDR